MKIPDPNTPWTIDHVGHAVENLDVAIGKYKATLGLQPTAREVVLEQKVEVVFFDTDSGSIELLAPLPGNVTLRKFLDSRGEGLHHIAYKVLDISKELLRLESQGISCIDSKPRKGSRNTLIAFLHPKSFGGVLVELIEEL